MMLVYVVGAFAGNTRAGNDEVMHAVGVLKGIYQDYTKEKAVSNVTRFYQPMPCQHIAECRRE